ncbi:predicted protein [Pyrenophora tritici-repentis Pt-1C-BFP]|uniref:Uncharacterized protein n=1 Tax=Pyrenophora tritici-repentis (strain Pt-1C-BFP) TaxID=426418 RepID=B2WQ00_PYRTR|nr:uncharacterized protein PTRG_12068 [Pyrenophora tritici-repentis Pt-1C-BFP]EDU46216.1 predicted protein [Pyrenophora tritici-repentis Pt-1C-BFP]
MNVSGIPDVAEIECTVSAGPGIQCSASRSGFITIQTKTESITILLQQIINKKRVTAKPVGQQPVQSVASSSGSNTSQVKFWFAGNNGPEDMRHDEGNDGSEDLLSSNDRRAPRSVGEVAKKSNNGTDNEFRGKSPACLGDDDKEDDIDASNSDGFNRNSRQKKPEPPISDEELTAICRKLASKTLKKWKLKQQQEKKSLEAFLSDWPNFFGYTRHASLEQWSYRALDTSEKFGGLQQPFHKVSLANWWNGCLKRRTSENTTTRVKALMVSALEPGFEKLESKEKNSKRKQIDRYVLQGEVITLMLTRAPGLVITVSDLITTPEYRTLWSNRHRSPVSGLNWINEKLIQDSELYSETVQSIFSLMHQHFSGSIPGLVMLGLSLIFVAFIQHLIPDRKASFTLSRSPIEPESGTNVASSCHQVTPSSKEIIPSYQISLCDQQSFVKSIGPSANATKRRKTRHATPQAQAQLYMIQNDNQDTSAPSLEASLINIHGENQALDVTIAANVLQSLQHGNQGYTGVAAAELPLGDQQQPLPPASGILEQCSVTEYGS